MLKQHLEFKKNLLPTKFIFFQERIKIKSKPNAVGSALEKIFLHNAETVRRSSGLFED